MRLKRCFWPIMLVLLALTACVPIPLAGPEKPTPTALLPLSAEELVHRAVEAMHRPGKVFFARLYIEDSDTPEVRTAKIWFDGERQTARREERRNGELAGVTVWEGWTSAHHAPEANRVYTSTLPIDFRLEGVNPLAAGLPDPVSGAGDGRHP